MLDEEGKSAAFQEIFDVSDWFRSLLATSAELSSFEFFLYETPPPGVLIPRERAVRVNLPAFFALHVSVKPFDREGPLTGVFFEGHLEISAAACAAREVL